MSYVSIEKQIQSVPEEYLDEVSMYIDYVLFKAGKKRKKQQKAHLHSSDVLSALWMAWRSRGV